MPALVDTLRMQHDEIEALVNSIGAALMAREPASLARHLAAFKAALLAHLEVEDRRLYPDLVAAVAGPNSALPSSIVETYQKNMLQIGETLRVFFEQFNDPIDLEAFARNWPMVAQLLAHRIESEEFTLYPMYQSLVHRES